MSEKITKADKLRDKVLGAIASTDWVHFVDELIAAVVEETLDSARPCCNAECRNKEVQCPGEMELHWVCTRCGHQHHATHKGD